MFVPLQKFMNEMGINFFVHLDCSYNNLYLSQRQILRAAAIINTNVTAYSKEHKKLNGKSSFR